jgi:DNA processing protein
LSRCQDAEDWLTLSFLPGLGCTLIARLVYHLGTPDAVLRDEAGVKGVPGVGPRLISLLRNTPQVTAARQRARTELERLARLNVTLLTPTNPAFPESLRTIPDSPVLLYCHGALGWLAQPAVAIIGARTATDYGRRIAAILASELAAQGIVIISGAAYGIDAAAHRGALAAGGGTVAVFGCGIDVVYPRSHADLFRDIANSGLLLSEYPLGTQPEAFRFPARNRLISGLVKGVVVVEATEKSGSLITARLALDQGREVFAVPGRIDSLKSAGTHRLIQQGAHLVHSVTDILEGLSWSNRGGVPDCRNPPVSVETAAVTDREQRLLDSLETYPRDIDTIVRLTGLAIVEVHGLLLQLELQGRIRALPGQHYERVFFS